MMNLDTLTGLLALGSLCAAACLGLRGAYLAQRQVFPDASVKTKPALRIDRQQF